MSRSLKLDLMKKISSKFLSCQRLIFRNFFLDTPNLKPEVKNSISCLSITEGEGVCPGPLSLILPLHSGLLY